MTDITRKLELLANHETGEPWPDEIWAQGMTSICAEALAEIDRLRLRIAVLSYRQPEATEYRISPIDSSAKFEQKVTHFTVRELIDTLAQADWGVTRLRKQPKP